MLEHLFGSKTRLKLLQIFFRDAERAFYMRELSRLAETQLNAVRRELRNLETIGIISPVDPGSVKTGELGTERSKYYKLNADFLLFLELKSLLTKSRLLEEQKLVDALRKRAGKVRLIVLAGGFVGAGDSPTDILVVGKVRPLSASRIIKDFEKSSGKSLRYTILSEKEYFERRDIGDKFLYNIFEGRHNVVLDDLKSDR